MKKICMLLSAVTTAMLLAAVVFAVQVADAKTLEDILKEKGILTESDYKEVTKSKPIDYKSGKGFTFTSADENFQLNIGGRILVRYTYLDKDLDTSSASDTSSFSLAKGQVWFQGYAYTKDLSYRLQVDLNQMGNSKGLEYAYLKYLFVEEFQLLAGQTKIPYSRQYLAASGNLQFVDTSIATKAFAPGYDLGVFASGNVVGGIISYDLGISGGAGQSTTSTDDSNAFFARVQLNPFGAFAYSEGDPELSQKPRVTAGSSYYRNSLKKTAATTFESNNVGPAQTTGWLGANVSAFNASETVDIDTFNADLAFKWKGAFAQAEFFWGKAEGKTSNATRKAIGYYAQAGYCIIPKKLEVAVRYAYLDQNRDRANDDQSEFMGGISYYFDNHNLKLQADVGNIHTHQTSGAHSTADIQYRIQMALVF